MRPHTFTRHVQRIAAAAIIATGCLAAPVASAQSSVSGSLDNVLAAGQPGPHRVEGNYFTSPTAPAEQKAQPGVAIVGPSTPITMGDHVCTIAVAGTDEAGRAVALTAGHCGGVGADVRAMDAPAAGVIGKVARVVAGDVAVIELNDHARVAAHYNNVAIHQVGGPSPAVLQEVCKTGVATGTSCGVTINATNDRLLAHLCGSFGDSGAPIYAGNRLLAVLNGGLAGLPACTTPLQGPVHAPTVGTPWAKISADLNRGGVGAGFRPAN
ncbi:hypothetical protein GC425_03340 [Corynebacterium sp. zg254]|uniref:Secreted protein n=1 Tax=Corynebacterium zhongnanshanii TaxID=2768834 RepID=A0ABQ6VF27_9CORY|nr:MULTISPECIES: hypothetical protein [Corynebacterium]KAB3523012.1 hypothetical protein F8377_02280 [Corynebacterium zhongnanshanii]MCR5913903.1 hypothetical protein [Corynebacterium sp. zg254]